MRAIVIQQYGGPEQLVIEEWPDPAPEPSHILIEVKAFGLNRAEVYMRKGVWGEVARISGIECVGVVRNDPRQRLKRGQKVVALMGGMGRTLNGSYAEYTSVPATNVMPIESKLSWEEMAAIPESYATAWTCLHRNLQLAPEQVLLVRGGTSALGQAAINIAVESGVRVLATTRSEARFPTLKSLGAHAALPDAPDLSDRVRALYPEGIDAVLDIVGNSTIFDSLRCLRRGGHACLAGFLGGPAPAQPFDALTQMPSGAQLSFFASFMFGTPQFPILDIPLQRIFDRVAAGAYKAAPARVFEFDQIQEAHRLMDGNLANGKFVVRL